MAIRKVCEVEVRVHRGDKVTLLFTLLKGGEPERDADGSLIRFGIELGRDDSVLASLCRNLACWITDLAANELQDQQQAVRRAAAPAQPQSPEAKQEGDGGRTPRRRTRAAQLPPEPPPGTLT